MGHALGIHGTSLDVPDNLHNSRDFGEVAQSPIAGFYLEHPGMSKVIPGAQETSLDTPEKHPCTLRHRRTVCGSPGHWCFLGIRYQPIRVL